MKNKKIFTIFAAVIAIGVIAVAFFSFLKARNVPTVTRNNAENSESDTPQQNKGDDLVRQKDLMAGQRICL